MKKFLVILFILCIALPVCAKTRQSEEIITPMAKIQKREYQTRTFSAEDKEYLMRAVLNVLQDEGFIVYNVNSFLGFIYGIKDFNISDSDADISKEFGFSKSRLNLNNVRVATIESNANFTLYGDSLKLRASFKRKLLNMYGNAIAIEDVTEQEYYDEFFAKVEKALLLQKTKI